MGLSESFVKHIGCLIPDRASRPVHITCREGIRSFQQWDFTGPTQFSYQPREYFVHAQATRAPVLGVLFPRPIDRFHLSAFKLYVPNDAAGLPPGMELEIRMGNGSKTAQTGLFQVNPSNAFATDGGWLLQITGRMFTQVDILARANVGLGAAAELRVEWMMLADLAGCCGAVDRQVNTESNGVGAIVTDITPP